MALLGAVKKAFLRRTPFGQNKLIDSTALRAEDNMLGGLSDGKIIYSQQFFPRVIYV